MSWIEHKPKHGQGDKRIWHRIFTPPTGGVSQVTSVYVVVVVNLETRRANSRGSLSQSRPDTRWDAALTLTDGRVLNADGQDYNERGCQQKLTRAINRLLTTIGDPTDCLLGEVRFR